MTATALIDESLFIKSPAAVYQRELVPVEDREQLIYLLNEAAELEHGACCSYLFAAFSLKDSVDEGLTPEQLAAVATWKRTIMGIAVQEMTHLALVTNLLSAIGGAPHFWKPDFPQRSAYAPEIQLALTGLSEQTLERFLYIERPEQIDLSRLAPDVHISKHRRLWMAEPQIMPVAPDFSSVGQLYRGIEAGLRDLSHRTGEARLFTGLPSCQATAEQFGMPDLMPVSDLNSAIAAIETIVAEGEGQRGDWRNAHFGRFLTTLREYRALAARDPRFSPARPVVENPCVRPPVTIGEAERTTQIEDRRTAAISQIFDAAYELMLAMLERFFRHEEETPAELRTLADIAIGLMAQVVAPLGELLTRLPVGAHLPGRTAGPSFSVSGRTYVTPHKQPAWLVLCERMNELADRCRALALDAGDIGALNGVAGAFAGFGRRLELSG